jgi:hypothetical protein
VKKVIAATALLAIAVTAVALNATAAPSTASHDRKSVTLKLVMKEVGFNFQDNPPRQGFNSPPLIGDQLTFTSDLLTRSGARAGTFGATCTVTRGGVRSNLVCYGLYSLKGGQIAGIAGPGRTEDTQIAVVGGTGAYAGVTGTALEVSRGENSFLTDVTINLTYP